eukprot:TRINITY_DN815_c0_g1_i1.p1 TRINITY_DN815_c0_g1~~TRINITY_DN815_c0_g1_i1.p1  ORF type:complete len:294 (+),score=48.79 TRINITY_DN815_c0_g1_i1:261-1142(+)
MEGTAFAEKVHKLLGSTAPHKIHSNPAKSKHLETATLSLQIGNHHMDVDFVNLRSETYSADSRIPTMAFGSPLDDAKRRDFTINSLFFNITDNRLEDWTGQGRADLAAGIIRTPVDPHATLLDDPLRALRAVRFAARLGFSLADDLIAAIPHPTTLRHLVQKVSRERRGIELNGIAVDAAKALQMGVYAAAVHGIFLLSKLNLYQSVFTIPDSYHLQDFVTADPFTAVNVTRWLCWVLQQNVFPWRSHDLEELRLILLAAYLIPFQRAQVLSPRKRAVPVVEVMMKESLKMSA